MISEFFEHWWAQDLVFVAVVALVVFLLRRGFRNEIWRRAGHRFRRDRIGIAALVVVGLYFLVGAMEMIQLPAEGGGNRSLLQVITSPIPKERRFSAPLASTTLSVKDSEALKGPHTHLLGTTETGEDTLVLTLRACRTALIIGGFTSLIYLIVGTLLGVLSGYFRGWVDDVIQYVYTVIYSVPEILLLAAIIIVLGKSLFAMCVALSMTSWVGLCRLVRGESLRLRERQFVDAARALGQSRWRIVTRHILPNVMHLVLISFVVGFSGLVRAEAILSYLGVGAPVGTPSWGAMIDGARNELSRDPLVWWNITAATGALLGLVLALNLLGDALRRAFDPKRS
jgi:peptide/nickel transport system permease protein